MAHASQSQQPSPATFFAACNAYQVSAALKAAVELDLFTAIGEGAVTAAALAQKCRATERGTRILCDFLTIHGMLTKHEGHYGLTPDSAVFLDQRSPAYSGSAVKFLMSPTMIGRAQNLAATIRSGQPDDSAISSDHPMWVEFARNMAPLVAAGADEIAAMVDNGKPCRVLDIAAGHGLFGITLAQRNPETRVTALDWPHVLDVAWENARARGIAGRYSVIPGSALEHDFGTGYDIVLLTNFLHHFDKQTCETILLKVHAALNDNGRAVVLEFVPNDDRVSPAMAAQFPMNMLNATPAGDAYTFAELDSMLRNAGFTGTEQRPLTRSVETVVIGSK